MFSWIQQHLFINEIDAFTLYSGFNKVVLFLILYTFMGFVSKHGEKRILVFFIYFELIQLLLVALLLFGVFVFPQKTPIFLTAAVFILGAAGTETAVFLALFMRYFRLTGVTLFLNDKNNIFRLKEISSVKFFQN